MTTRLAKLAAISAAVLGALTLPFAATTASAQTNNNPTTFQLVVVTYYANMVSTPVIVASFSSMSNCEAAGKDIVRSSTTSSHPALQTICVRANDNGTQPPTPP